MSQCCFLNADVTKIFSCSEYEATIPDLVVSSDEFLSQKVAALLSHYPPVIRLISYRTFLIEIEAIYYYLQQNRNHCFF
jgi:hypothetical protein